MAITLKTPSLGLSGKRAVVAGTHQAFTMAAAAALVQAGAEFTFVSPNDSDLSQVVSDLRKLTDNASVSGVVLDISDSKAVDRFFSSAAPFCILINGSAVAHEKLFNVTTDSDIDNHFRTNLDTAMYLSRAAARRMQQGYAAGIFKGASIINLSSPLGLVGRARQTLDCASKHALEGFSKALAWELGPNQIRVNTLCPLLEDAQSDNAALPNNALQRFCSLEDMMGAIVFLASDAAACITGTALKLDGGLTAA
jgi:NAD(P)-dependent dehydrogenase (short-subunit alcohol dehydrogenase family)